MCGTIICKIVTNVVLKEKEKPSSSQKKKIGYQNIPFSAMRSFETECNEYMKCPPRPFIFPARKPKKIIHKDPSNN